MVQGDGGDRHDRPKAKPGSAEDRIYDALLAAGSVWHGGNAWTCPNPSHDDTNPSFAVDPRADGTGVVITCSVCGQDGFQDILKSLGFKNSKALKDSVSEPISTTWTYRDEKGVGVFQVCRMDFPSGARKFMQRLVGGTYKDGVKGVRPLLLNLPAIREAVEAEYSDPIYVVEGEKCVSFLAVRGVLATCNSMGTDAWRDEHTEQLRGALDVVVVADNDEHGYKHALSVAQAIRGVVEKVRVARSVTDGYGDDVVDHVLAGHELEELRFLKPAELREIVAEAPAGKRVPIDIEREESRPSADGPDKAYQAKVAARASELRLDRDARALLDEEQTQAIATPRVWLLDEFLSEADRDVPYRVDRLWPLGGRVLLTAQYKVGKTTLLANLIRSLVDGALFLGAFQVTQAARVVLIDDELDERTLRAWLRDHRIEHTDRVSVICLRGAVSTFDILTKPGRERWARLIGPADVLLLDCLRPVLDAHSLDESHEAGKLLVALDEFCQLAGIGEALLVHHMGHTGERSRGDSRLLDWPDALWKLTRATSGEEASPRFFSAYGRDVDVAEGQLAYNSSSRHLTFDPDSGSRKTVASDALVQEVVRYVNGHPACTSGSVERGVGGDNKAVRAALEDAVTTGLILRLDKGNAKLHYGLGDNAKFDAARAKYNARKQLRDEP